jgi:hypothetical protein
MTGVSIYIVTGKWTARYVKLIFVEFELNLTNIFSLYIYVEMADRQWLNIHVFCEKETTSISLKIQEIILITMFSKYWMKFDILWGINNLRKLKIDGSHFDYLYKASKPQHYIVFITSYIIAYCIILKSKFHVCFSVAMQFTVSAWIKYYLRHIFSQELLVPLLY